MDKSLAGNGTLGEVNPTQLFAGEADVVTSRGLVKIGLIFQQFEVFAKDADDKIVKFDPAGAAPLNRAIGILPHAINTSATGTNKDTFSPYYIGGIFNHEALIWPGSVTTLAARKKAFEGTNLNVEKVL